jgi:hypothetical protein
MFEHQNKQPNGILNAPEIVKWIWATLGRTRTCSFPASTVSKHMKFHEKYHQFPSTNIDFCQVLLRNLLIPSSKLT